MDEIHLTKKDFRIEWFSGTGAGGQHRNKHQNCCRIIHIESGLKSQGMDNKSRVANQKDAFEKLAIMIISYYNNDKRKDVRVVTISSGVSSTETLNSSDTEAHDKLLSSFEMSFVFPLHCVCASSLHVV